MSEKQTRRHAQVVSCRRQKMTYSGGNVDRNSRMLANACGHVLEHGNTDVNGGPTVPQHCALADRHERRYGTGGSLHRRRDLTRDVALCAQGQERNTASKEYDARYTHNTLAVDSP
jgi:hypothetical protein